MIEFPDDGGSNPASEPKGVGGAPWHPKGANQIQHSELVEHVREGLNPRGHHRLCRVNMPTEWSSECNCPRDEIEDAHAALDSLAERLAALESDRNSWMKVAKQYETALADRGLL